MPKYELLRRHLQATRKPRLEITFSQIERILGSRLPASARRHPAWWSNNEGSHVQALAWREPGYRTEHVDLADERVTFVADKERSPERSLGTGANAKGVETLFGCMKGTTVVMPGVDLAQPVAPEWGKLGDE